MAHEAAEPSDDQDQRHAGEPGAMPEESAAEERWRRTFYLHYDLATGRVIEMIPASQAPPQVRPGTAVETIVAS